MSETIRRDMSDQLTDTLHVLVQACHDVRVTTERPTPDSVDADLVRWQAIVWRAADLLADPLGPGRTAWSRTMGLEVAAREWVRAADAYILYRAMVAPWRADAFEQHIGPVTSHLRKWEAGVRWNVRN